jgi:hypothetical protein
VPAAAVIPAPIAYIKVVAVKKLVVGFLGRRMGRWPNGCVCLYSWRSIRGWMPLGIRLLGGGIPPFTVKKLECSKQA